MIGGARFIGREHELTALRADLDAALHGEGRIVRVEGPPGIGKTFLATRLAADARDRGADVVWGRCREQAASRAYWPWIQALGACRSAAGREAAERLAGGPQRDDLVSPMDPEGARLELYARTTRAIAKAAAESPLVLLFDDLQWADPGSIDLLEFAGPELRALPVLVLSTTRPDDGEQAARVRALGRDLSLQALSPSETSDLLLREIGRAPADDLVAEVHELTSGNPFFVIEMAQLLGSVETGAGGATPKLPPRAKEILSRRLALVPEATRAALETAAVFGSEFRLDLLARALGQDAPTTLAHLESAVRAGLVRAVPEALQHYVFSHALTRDALYEVLPQAERAARHRVVAHAYETLEGEALRDHVFELSHHAFEAARVGDPGPAIRHACDAGDQALNTFAFESAALQFERALAAIDLAGDAAGEERLRAHLGYWIACRRTGRLADAVPHLREALTRARTLGPLSFAQTVNRVAQQRTEFLVADLETNALLEEALDRLPDETSPLRAQLLGSLALGLHLAPDAEQRRVELSREAVEMARRCDDRSTTSFVRWCQLATLLDPRQLDERARAIDEVLSDPNTSAQAELAARIMRINDIAQLGDRKGLDAELAVFEQRTDDLGLPYFHWQVTTNRAAIAMLEGRFAEAEQLIVAGLVEGERVAPKSAGVRFATQLFWLRGWQGRLPEVEPLVEQSVEETHVLPAWRCALAGFYAHAGRFTEARREFEALAADDFRDVPRDATWLIGMALLADVCCRLEDRERAVLLRRALLPHSGQVAIAHPLILMNCLFDLRLALLSALLEDYDAAFAHFEQAQAIAERMRGLPWQADIRYQMAETHAKRAAAGDFEAATLLLDEAEQIAKPLGMALLLGWTSSLRERLENRQEARAIATGTDGPTRSFTDNVVQLPGTRPQDSPPAMFRREGDVWSLAFEGRATRFKHMRGLAHLARLIAEPGREFHASDLAGTARGDDVGDAGEQLDAQARADYEARLREAREDLEEAERLNDRGRAERRSEEIAWLAGELSRGFGLAGRERRAGSASERARLSVTRAIKYAVGKIDAHDPALADHLRRNVRTGTFCSYAPAARDEITWRL